MMILKQKALWPLITLLFFMNFFSGTEVQAVPRSYASLHKKPEVHLTIFVHGSIFSGLSVLNMHRVIKDDLPKASLYTRAISRLRKYDILRQDQILQQEGFHPLRSLTFDYGDLSFHECKTAAPYIVPPYFACDNLVQQHTIDHVAYSFGHLGLLSVSYRRDVAEDFYDELCQRISELQREYKKVVITIVTHSHGGNIALNLAYWEDQKQHGLMVDNLIMLGCPIQVETAPYAFNPTFMHVYNLYSDGDRVQNADSISTQNRASYRQIFDKRLKIDRTGMNVVKDVRLLVNKDRKRIDHANMWLMGLSKKACKTLDPLPIAVLAPMIVHAADQINKEQLDCNIKSTNRDLSIQMSLHGHSDVLVQTDNIHAHAVAWNKAVVESWAPDYSSRSVVFNFKVRKALYDAFKDWLKDRHHF